MSARVLVVDDEPMLREVVARGLVEAHGGDIWIEDSSPTSVAFRIPLPV